MYLIANQLELNNGTRRDRAECLADSEQLIPAPVIQKRGVLYVLAETETMAEGRPRPGDIDLCKQAQEIVIQEFYNFNPSASVTSSLRHALEKANQAVYNANSALLPPERRGMGITVALVRAGEVYTAQLPPAQAYLVHEEQVHYLPALENRPPGTTGGPRVVQARTGTDPQATLPLPRTQAAPALGRYTSIEPVLLRNVFAAGDVLVLCSAAFARALQQSDLERIMAGQDSRSVLLNLSEFARNNDIVDGYCLAVGARPDFSQRPTVQPVESARHNPTGTRNIRPGLFSPRNGSKPAPAATPLERAIAPAGQDDYTYEDSPAQPAVAPQVTEPLPNSQPESQDFQRPAPPARGTPIVAGQPPAEEDFTDPIAPLSRSGQHEQAWLQREEDDLNRPAYLKGRPLPQETEPGPFHDNAFKNQYAGSFHPASQPGQRNYTYSNPAQDPVMTGRPTSQYPAATPPPPHPPLPTIQPAPDPFGEAPAKKSRWGGRYKAAIQARLAAPKNNSPYLDMVGGDGYDTPAGKKGLTALSPQRKRLLLLGTAAALALAVLLLVVSVVTSAVTGGNSKAVEAVKAAGVKQAQALQFAAADPVRARSLVNQAQADLERARKEKPDLADIRRVENELKATLNTINLVVIPPDLRIAFDLSSQGTGTSLTRGLLSPTGDSLYLLDSGQGVVYNAELTGPVKPILKTGDKAANSAATFGKPVAMAARPDGLMVLDDANALWIYNRNNNSWTAQALGGTAAWSSKIVRQAASYQGNLYLLGPASGQILKYNAGSYNGNPDQWLNPDLAGTLDLDNAQGFSIDGTVYALDKTGKVLQLARPAGKDKGEVIKQFDLKTQDHLGPFLNGGKTLNVGSLDFPYFFIVDAEKRVMQFSKEDGAFLQQFQSTATGKEFDNLQDLVIDEANRKLYVLGPKKVYVFNLSEPVQSGQPAGSATPGSPLPATTPKTPGNVTVINANPTAKP